MEIKNITVNGDLGNLKKLEIEGYYELQEDVEVIIEFEDIDDIVVNGSKGYYFDFASIPTPLEWFLAPDHEMVVLASFVHDICSHWRYVNVKFSAKLMWNLMRWYIKHNVDRGYKHFKYKFKSNIVFLALYCSKTSRDAFRDINVADAHNKKFSSIK
jgi:hypothetical protein